MNKKVNVFLGLAVAVMTLVAVLVLFAPMFYDSFYDQAQGGSEWGSVFQVMFYGYSHKTSTTVGVPLLIVGFGLECLAFLGAFVTAASNGKKAIVMFGIEAVLLIGAGIIFLLGKKFYVSANGAFSNGNYNSSLVLGAGSICSIVFAWLGALLSIYGAYNTATNL